MQAVKAAQEISNLTTVDSQLMAQVSESSVCMARQTQLMVAYALRCVIYASSKVLIQTRHEVRMQPYVSTGHGRSVLLCYLVSHAVALCCMSCWPWLGAPRSDL